MSYQNPIPRGGLRHPTEMSGLTSPRESGSVQNQWKTALQAIERAHSAGNSTGLLARQINQRQQYPNASVFYPFKVYQLPPSLRINPSATDWLKVRVRTGRILHSGITTVSGTDGSPVPEIETYLDNSTTYSDIPVPDNTAAFYIWVKISTNQLYFGTSPGGASIPTTSPPWYTASADTWATFPNTDSDHVIIAKIDSQTHHAQQRLIITQFIRADIPLFFSSGGGGGGLTSIDGPINQVIPLSDGTMWIIGTFTHINGFYRPLIAKLNYDLSLNYSAVIPAVDNTAINLPDCCVDSSDNIYIVGRYLSAIQSQNLNSGNQTIQIASWASNGSVNTAFNAVPTLAPGNPGWVFGTSVSTYPIVIIPYGTKFLIPGPFTVYGGSHTSTQPSPSFLTINSDGSWNNFNTVAFSGAASGNAIGGIYDSVNAFVWVAQGTTVVRYDPTVPSGYAAVGSFTGSIARFGFAMQSSGSKLVIGGSFTETGFGLTTANGIVRTTGAGVAFFDPVFNSGGTGFIFGGIVVGPNSIATDSSDNIYCAGAFSNYNGASVGPRIIRLQPSGAIDSTWTANIPFAAGNGDPNHILVDSDGTILVAGNFVSVKDNTGSTFTRLNIARFNPSGTIV